MSAHDAISLDGHVHDPNREDYMRRYLLAYRRAAEETEDETLAAVFRALADDETRRADRLLQLLEQSLA